jgi:hypothetical protein
LVNLPFKTGGWCYCYGGLSHKAEGRGPMRGGNLRYQVDLSCWFSFLCGSFPVSKWWIRLSDLGRPITIKFEIWNAKASCGYHLSSSCWMGRVCFCWFQWKHLFSSSH